MLECQIESGGKREKMARRSFIMGYHVYSLKQKMPFNVTLNLIFITQGLTSPHFTRQVLCKRHFVAFLRVFHVGIGSVVGKLSVPPVYASRELF